MGSAHIFHKISVAPMMDWTDRHFRYLMRLITQHTLLYTEMITCAAVLHGDHSKLLAYHPQEHPIALQLGGSDPLALAQAARIAEQLGYDEVNLNVGCPSGRVSDGHFGACLMKEPELVARCVAAMKAAVNIPITVKTRIGVDDYDSYEHLQHFLRCIVDAGCETVILHARKAWLQGLSPKENRSVPPLCYEVVYRCKQDFPRLNIIINGGLQTLDHIRVELTKVDGVMIGRQAYSEPFLFSAVDADFYDNTRPPLSRFEVVRQFLPYAEQQLKEGARLTNLTRHLLGLFHGTPGARSWRRHISEHAHRAGAGVEVIEQAILKIQNL